MCPKIGEKKSFHRLKKNFINICFLDFFPHFSQSVNSSRIYPATMKKILRCSIQKMVYEHLPVVHPFIYLQSIFHLNKVCFYQIFIPRSLFATEGFLSFFHSLFVVIVTEKKNILLRYLHQQWEKKVNFVKINLFFFSIAI